MIEFRIRYIFLYFLYGIERRLYSKISLVDWNMTSSVQSREIIIKWLFRLLCNCRWSTCGHRHISLLHKKSRDSLLALILHLGWTRSSGFLGCGSSSFLQISFRLFSTRSLCYFTRRTTFRGWDQVITLVRLRGEHFEIWFRLWNTLYARLFTGSSGRLLQLLFIS